MLESTATNDDDRPVPEPVFMFDPSEPVVSPPFKFDEQGRILPFTPAERAMRMEAIRRMIEELKSVENGPEEDDRDFFRAMDADRPDFPLFEGMY